MPYKDKSKQREYQNAWTKEKRSYYNKIKNDVRERNSQYLYDYLLNHPCVDCGEYDPIVLEFDHVRGIKIRNVNRVANWASSITALQEEIDKCDVRCANCHRRRTARIGNHFRSRIP